MIVGKRNAMEEETAPCSGTARIEGGDEGVERGTDALGENF